MQIFHHWSWLPVSCSILAGVLVLVEPAHARQTTVTGGASTSYDFRSRSYQQEVSGTNSDEGDAKKLGIGPEVSVVSQGIYDVFSLRYAPTLYYDYISEDTGVNHQLNFKEDRQLSRFWSLTLSDDFTRSDDPSVSYSSAQTSSSSNSAVPGQTQTTSADQLSRDLSGQTYWTNTATVQTAYTLSAASRIGGGYSYSVLRNDDGSGGYTSQQDADDYNDYDKHTFFTNYTHGFNQNWRSSLGLNYTRGLYDNDPSTTGIGTPDLDQYGGDLGIDYIQDPSTFYPLKYSSSETQYDGDTRPGFQVHNGSAGWDHTFDPRNRLALGAGPSYAKTDGLDGTWGYNAYMNYTRQYEHASFALLLSKQFEAQNFTGSQDSGLTDTYSARATFRYQYTEHLALDLFGGYSWQSTYDPQGDYLTAAEGETPDPGDTTGDLSYDKDIYEAGAGCSYSFAQWYQAGVRYVYYVSDGHLGSDQYTDHQVLFTLSAKKELWRW